MRLLILFIVFLISQIAFGQEEMAENETGSMTRFSQYFYERYKHPESARVKKIEGELIVDFYINNQEEMVADSIKLISGVSAECDSLALKIIKETHRPVPAPNDGIN
jgi:hypothetical protein